MGLRQCPQMTSSIRKRPRESEGKAQVAIPVCIKVPKPNSSERAFYNHLSSDPATQRRKWFASACENYVGRPKCDGGWYHVPEVKKGSIWCNPFTLKEYSLPES